MQNDFWNRLKDNIKAKLAIAGSAIALILAPLKQCPREGEALKGAIEHVPVTEFHMPKAKFKAKSPIGKKAAKWDDLKYADDVFRVIDTNSFSNTSFPKGNDITIRPSAEFKTSPVFRTKGPQMPLMSAPVYSTYVDTSTFDGKMKKLRQDIEHTKSTFSTGFNYERPRLKNQTDNPKKRVK